MILHCLDNTTVEKDGRKVGITPPYGSIILDGISLAPRTFKTRSWGVSISDSFIVFTGAKVTLDIILYARSEN